jgi:hypothetical protein
MNRGTRKVVRTVVALVLVACRGPVSRAAAAPAPVVIAGIPHVRQKPDFCGEACVEMVLKKLGFRMDQDGVFDRSGLDPALGRGCHTADLAQAMKLIGFDVGPVWHSVGDAHADRHVERAWQALHADLTNGVPSIVCTRFDRSPRASEHFRLVVGYDPEADAVIYHDPALDNGGYRRMPRKALLTLWPLPVGRRRAAAIRLRCEPRAIVAAAPAAGFTAADYAQHIMALKPRIADRAFAVAVEPPFVVIGDDTPERVRRYAARTVRWAVDKLKQDYFERDPDTIIDIWLFRDARSYERNTRALFGRRPTTPFGFYADDDNALIMNIATGGGTLVHEIVHPFVRANFPACPAWFNEGLGSLYEQSAERSGRIVGLTNWRLAGLKDVIRAGRLPSFPELLTAGDSAFYASARGNNYAQARYLCYYLQEKGLLVRFYHEFRKRCAEDPSGLGTLRKVLGEDDLDAFKAQWEQFVMQLTFP